MAQSRLIKKYANRRLYDTTTSSHLKLSDIRELIQAGENVRIVDDVSGEDLTRAILLQIIADEEHVGRPMLDQELLMRLIRVYGNPAQELMSDFLLRSFDTFMQQQRQLQEQMRAAMTATPLDSLNELFQNNLDAFERFQRAMLGSISPASKDPDDDTDDDAGKTPR